ncbi:hypothetical protein [Herbaspirillum robiniae]|uniref:Uncharacterized protein n=1 Tax=Herbaspirillum robiniae TaxID=2014887 RepID=A0A246WX38_9BURK|nr:hypothetical protein [Herbaspirillum robiniae]NUU00894.1 hypothetical protein [Herbaspirillum robiniae]OWY31261.1 hypothetical protein CEJ42_04230 [Herbaspirillum robiniae]
MTVLNATRFSSFFKLCLIAGAAALLASCASQEPVPVTETKPVLPQILKSPAASQPTWATQLVTGNFSCELGNKVELRMDGRVTDGVTLEWKGRSYTMNPVSTSTGAVRLENKGEGLVWIQIPSKSMLLNSKIGQQLANDCKVR